MEEYLNFAKEIALKAGDIMMKYFTCDNGASYKGDRTIVTLADKEINDYLIKRVQEKYKNHAVDGEEAQNGASRYVWVCDPVDGTAMYARHIPVATFSLALVIDGEPNVGVVYDPFTNSMYTAIKGCGAYKNDVKITVNDYMLDDMRSSSHCDMWQNPDYDDSKIIAELKKQTQNISDIGSIVRVGCLVATGDFTVGIFTGTTHKNCDIAAVKLIVEEAGGKVTDLFGNEQRYDASINGAVLSNGKVHDKVIAIIKENMIAK